MPSWREILEETRALGTTIDFVRRKYLQQLADLTGRNVIVYYSGWLQKGDLKDRHAQISDGDKNGFMAVVHGLDRKRGLDLILHTPGGEIAATESIIHYLRQMFGTDIRAIVPQMAMSCGTMIALACKSVVMGKHSNLGPIDPQVGGLSAHALLEAWEEAKLDIARNPSLGNLWAPISQKYPAGILNVCRQAVQLSTKIAQESLVTGMFEGDPDAEAKAQVIVEYLGSHKDTLTHARHLHREDVSAKGLKVEALEEDQRLQDLVLTVHHACIQTLTTTSAYKVIENSKGIAHISFLQNILMLQQNPS